VVCNRKSGVAVRKGGMLVFRDNYTLPTAQISPLPTTISLDRSKMLYEVVDFLRTKEVREAVHKLLRDQPKTFFLEGIRKLVDRWTKCIKKEGDYVEKWRACSGLHLCK